MKVYLGSAVTDLAHDLADRPIPCVEVAAPSHEVGLSVQALTSQIHDLDYLRTTFEPDGAHETISADTEAVLAAVTDAMVIGDTSAAIAPGRRGPVNAIAVASLAVTLYHPDLRLVILDLDLDTAPDTASRTKGMRNVTQVDIAVTGEPYDGSRIVPLDNYRDEVYGAVDLALSMHPDLVIACLSNDRCGTAITPTALMARDVAVATACGLSEVPVAFVANAAPRSQGIEMLRLSLTAFARVC